MKIELCAATVEAIKLAKECKVDRIELCQVLELGGVTPSPGIIEYAVAYGLETHVLIRPRPGGFIYTEEEKEIMLRNALECKELGASGVVVGVLNAFGDIDTGFLELVRSKVGGEMQITFHRAFDDIMNGYRDKCSRYVFLVNSRKIKDFTEHPVHDNSELSQILQTRIITCGRWISAQCLGNHQDPIERIPNVM